jgi:hypothetical protein
MQQESKGVSMKNIFKAPIMAAVFAGLILVFAASGAKADPIQGAMSISGQYQPVNGSTGASTTLGAATGLDFVALIGGPATPGVAGQFLVNAAVGGFAPYVGQIGAIKDFTFSGAGSLNYPNTPVAMFQTLAGPPSLSFTLSTISVVNQSAALLNLEGTGIFTVTGFDPTPGTFVFSANAAGGTFSFSASQSSIPEPTSMLLLGTGLLGAAGAIRRRFKAQS